MPNLDSITARVPASTSNLGSGFDTLGLAFKVYNYVTVSRNGTRTSRSVSPLPPQEAGAANKLVREAVALFFRRTRTVPFGVNVAVKSEFPCGRGLGFSATVRLGAMACLNELAGTQLDRPRLLELATALEGHPDNASPSAFGGFTISTILGKEVRCLHFKVSSKVWFVTLLPYFGIGTEHARALLPASYVRADTAHALNRAAMITAAFAQRDYPALNGLFDDRVHQPYRESLIPALPAVIKAGVKAGAIGGWLSGSGSAIICMTLVSPHRVAKAMHNELAASDVRIFTAENQGFSLMAKTGAKAKKAA